MFKILLNYSYQLTFSELKEKLEKLNDYNASDEKENEIIVNIFNEIIGQIKGNHKLKDHFSELLSRIEKAVSNKRKITEPEKRSLVSELRERLRHLNVKNIDDLVGE